MIDPFSLVRGTEVSVTVEETIIIGKIVEFVFGNLYSDHPDTFYLSVLSNDGYSYVLPLGTIKSIILVKQVKEPFYFRLIPNWFFSVLPNIK